MAGNATERLYLLMNAGRHPRQWSSCIDDIPLDRLGEEESIRAITFFEREGDPERRERIRQLSANLRALLSTE